MLKKDTSTASTQIPPAFRDRYVIRCIEESFGPSSKGNPLITLEWEICGWQAPDGTLQETIVRSGKKYMIAGKRNIFSYFTLISGPSGNTYLEFREKAKLPISEEGIDDSNPTLDHKDLVMNAILSTEELQQRKALSEEEKEDLKAKGEPLLGKPILDDDGKPIITYRVKIDMFLGRSSVEINRPF